MWLEPESELEPQQEPDPVDSRPVTVDKPEDDGYDRLEITVGELSKQWKMQQVNGGTPSSGCTSEWQRLGDHFERLSFQ